MTDRELDHTVWKILGRDDYEARVNGFSPATSLADAMEAAIKTRLFCEDTYTDIMQIRRSHHCFLTQIGDTGDFAVIQRSSSSPPPSSLGQSELRQEAPYFRTLSRDKAPERAICLAIVELSPREENT